MAIDNTEAARFLDFQRQKMNKPITMSEFIGKYKNKWINYCEMIIDEKGLVHVLQGSHTTTLSAIACNKLDLSSKEYYDQVPKSFYSNMDLYNLSITHAISVRFDFQLCYGKPNRYAMHAYQELVKSKMIRENILDDKVLENQ